MTKSTGRELPQKANTHQKKNLSLLTGRAERVAEGLAPGAEEEDRAAPEARICASIYARARARVFLFSFLFSPPIFFIYIKNFWT